MEQPLRIGIIGAGRFAQEHIERLAGNPEARIVAVCDVAEESLARTRERHGAALAGAAFYHGHGGLLAETRPDAVVICSPHHTHHAQAVASLEAGAHVLMEKPLANTLEEAHEIASLAEATGRVVGVAFQRRTWADVRFVKALIESGQYGPVQAVTALHQESWQAATAGTWRQDPRLSGGGFLHDGGSHLLDLMLWTTGLTPTRLSAVEDRRGTEADVNTMLVIGFAGGALASAALIGGCGGHWRQQMTVCCEGATILLDISAGLSITETSGRTVTPGPDEKPAATDVDTNFLQAIRGREPIAATPAWGIQIMRLIAAIGQSASAGGAAILLETSVPESRYWPDPQAD